MSRNMSCWLTRDAVRARTKTVTRRHVDSWAFLKVGDILNLVEKGQGIPKGGKVVRLARVEIVDVRIEPLYDIDDEDVRREGVDDMDAGEFCAWWLDEHNVPAFDSQTDAMRYLVRRIEWRYLS